MPLMSRPLVLPWEIIERIINYASDDLDLLRSFSLTCRQLRPRSFSLIIAQHVFLCSKDRMLAFRNILLANTKLQRLVHSITISPADFPPFPLVKVLPHLSTLGLISHGYEKCNGPQERPAIVLHSMLLGWYRSLGTRIRTLSLDHLSFPDCRELCRLLIAFPNVIQITCNDIYITSPANRGPAMEVVKAKLSDQLRLETLEVRVQAR